MKKPARRKGYAQGGKVAPGPDRDVTPPDPVFPRTLGARQIPTRVDRPGWNAKDIPVPPPTGNNAFGSRPWQTEPMAKGGKVKKVIPVRKRR